MIAIREETTLHELKEIAKKWAENTSREEIVKRTIEAGTNLDRLLKADLEPKDRAVLVGRVLRDVLQTAVTFDLDPVGCLVLADR